MTEAYHRARRLFALFSGILIVWEYIGVEVADKTTGAATAKVPVADTAVTLRNPEVIPLIIFILVLYFAFRFSVEWVRCPRNVRYQKVSIVDGVFAYLVGLSAIVLFGLQRISEFRLAESTTPTGLIFVFTGGVTSGLLHAFLRTAFRTQISFLASTIIAPLATLTVLLITQALVPSAPIPWLPLVIVLFSSNLLGNALHAIKPK